MKETGAVAFLATFHLSAEVVVLLLKGGVNRVGFNQSFGDFDKVPVSQRVVEGRQWLALCLDRKAYFVDDHSTNQSIVLPRNVAKNILRDKRWAESGEYDYSYFFSSEIEGAVRLDWNGDHVGEIEEGDVLLTAYAPLVFEFV